jgi:hypothetical protein
LYNLYILVRLDEVLPDITACVPQASTTTSGGFPFPRELRPLLPSALPYAHGVSKSIEKSRGWNQLWC